MLVIAALCITNYLALFHDEFRIAMLGGGYKEKEPGTEVRATEELERVALSLGVSAADVATNVKYLMEKNNKAVTENAVLHRELNTARKLHQDLSVQHRELDKRTKVAAQKLSKNVATRTARGVARHLGGAAGESIPVLGTAVIAAMLALDVKDACDLLRDINEMNRSVGVKVVDDNKVCGIKVPDQSELAETVSQNWNAAYQAAAFQVGRPPAIPNVTWNSIKSQVCTVVEVPLACP